MFSAAQVSTQQVHLHVGCCWTKNKPVSVFALFAAYRGFLHPIKVSSSSAAWPSVATPFMQALVSYFSAANLASLPSFSQMQKPVASGLHYLSTPALYKCFKRICASLWLMSALLRNFWAAVVALCEDGVMSPHLLFSFYTLMFYFLSFLLLFLSQNFIFCLFFPPLLIVNFV